MKKLILCLIILLCCGCDVNYEIYIKDNNISEKFNIIYNNMNEEDKQKIKNEIFISLESDPYIQNSNFTFNESYNNIFNYENNYSFNDYNQSFLLNECFKNVKLNNNNGILSIKLDSFSCYENYDELDTINVTVITDLDIFDSNYDENINNRYIWNINKDNYLYKEIVLNIRYSKDITNIINNNSDNFINYVIYLISIIIIIFISSIYFKYKKYNH